MYTSTEVLAWIGIAGGIGFFTGIAVTLSYEDLLDKKRRKTIKKLKARLVRNSRSEPYHLPRSTSRATYGD